MSKLSIKSNNLGSHNLDAVRPSMFQSPILRAHLSGPVHYWFSKVFIAPVIASDRDPVTLDTAAATEEFVALDWVFIGVFSGKLSFVG